MRKKKESLILLTIKHRLTILALSGYILNGIFYFVVSFNTLKQISNLISLLNIVMTVIFSSIVLFLNSHLISGKWKLRKWMRNSVIFLMLPTFTWFGILSGLMPEYAFFGLLVYFGGTVAGIGIVRYNTFLIIWLMHAVGLFTGFFLAGPKEQVSIILICSISIALLIFAIWLSSASHHYLRINSSVAKLLRASRRDKRLLSVERDRSEKLLLNILPKDVATELKAIGKTEPKLFESVTIMFTDFVGFTKIAEHLTPVDLVQELDKCFSYFDQVMKKYKLEKLKTIGDSYMCAGGIPISNRTHHIDSMLAAMEIQSFMNKMKEIKAAHGFPYWELRLGLHSGNVVAGVVGEMKFAYDVWGDTVNTASRMESSGQPGKINISADTYNLISKYFDCEHRGKIKAKNKGEIDMYFVNKIRAEYARDTEGRIPNGQFLLEYEAMA
jgi:class 3 adenylate cyclase